MNALDDDAVRAQRVEFDGGRGVPVGFHDVRVFPRLDDGEGDDGGDDRQRADECENVFDHVGEIFAFARRKRKENERGGEKFSPDSPARRSRR